MDQKKLHSYLYGDWVDKPDPYKDLAEHYHRVCEAFDRAVCGERGLPKI